MEKSAIRNKSIRVTYRTKDTNTT